MPGSTRLWAVFFREKTVSAMMIGYRHKARIRAVLIATALTAPALSAASPLPDSAYVLDLGGERFDLRQRAPRYAREAGANLRLVQFIGPIQPQWLRDMKADGVQPLQYIHPYSYVVWADAQGMARVKARDEVRASGDFVPEFRISQASRGLDEKVRSVMLMLSRKLDASRLDADMQALGAQIGTRAVLDANFEVMQVRIAGNRIEQLGALPGVFAVQRIEPITETEAMRSELGQQSVVGGHGGPPNYVITPGYAQWLQNLGYDGTGVRVGIVDGGVRETHVDLASRMDPCASHTTPTSCEMSVSDHGTHVAGAVAGTGESGITLNQFLRGQGVAPGARLVSQRYGSFLGAGPGGMKVDAMLKLFRESALNGALLTNNSWGPTSTPQGYDIPTRQVDMIVRDAVNDQDGQQPVLAVWSVMNGGGDSSQGACRPSSLGSPDEAKNLFAVGSTRLLAGVNQVSGSGIFDVSGNSAHGPACDGRRVPHIVAPGCSTDSTAAASDTAFNTKCGTSMASPVVSGAASLFIQKYRDTHDDATPSPALIKAAITVFAKNLVGQKNADDTEMGHRPDRFQGYGRLDMAAALLPESPVLYFEQDQVFDASGQHWEKRIKAADPDKPMRVMLVWTDAPGAGLAGTTPAWVNNLDLSLHKGDELYRGNAIGVDGWSVAGAVADEKNNMEAVYLSVDQHGGAEITLRVDATNIAADALNPHQPGDPAQDFALACDNCELVSDGPGPGPDPEPTPPSSRNLFRDGFEEN